jgi:DNA-binding NarL/FixJ family response regulator
VTIRIGVTDDQALVRAGFAAILDKQPDIELVGEAENGRVALELAERERPDVMLMDVRMPVMDGIEATRRLGRIPSPPRVLMLTTFDLNEYVYEAMKAGASGFMLKDVPREELANAVRTIARGEALLSPAITRRLIEDYVSRPPPGGAGSAAFADLTPRELEVLGLIARGRSNSEIGQDLYLSEGTVKTHVTRVLRKLEVRDRVQAVIAAYENGLVRPHG